MAIIFPTALGWRGRNGATAPLNCWVKDPQLGKCCLGPPERGLAGHVLGLAPQGDCHSREGAETQAVDFQE